MKSFLLSTTLLMGLSAPAWALINEIEIDAGTSGSVKTLAINQETTTLGNTVKSISGAATALPVTGGWDTISITQSGGNDALYGALNATTASTGTLHATYIGANNTHTLKIGTTTVPVSPTVTINVNGASNSITDTLNGASLDYTLSVPGSTNTITNHVSASSSVYLHETVGGSTNIIDNEISGGTQASLTEGISGSNNGIYVTMDGGGSQTSNLIFDSASFVTYTQLSHGSGSGAVVNLYGVTGAGILPAIVNVTQTAAATSAQATLTVTGTSINTMGTGAGPTGSGLTGGVNVYQATPNATLNASVVANAPGFTVNISQ